MARTITSATVGPLVLARTHNPLTITGTGSVIASGIGADAIDGAAGTTWRVGNAGTISSASRYGIYFAGAGMITNSAKIFGGTDAILLAAGGSVSNSAGATISGTIRGIRVLSAGSATVTNAGSISGGGVSVLPPGYAVDLEGGGRVTNTGSMTGGEDGIRIMNAIGQVVNSGVVRATVDDGIGIFAGGSVTNSAGGTITGTKGAGIFITGGAGGVTNAGSIAGNFGIFLQGGSGTVTNAGTISGASLAVKFADDATNRLVVDPTAVFGGGVDGGTLSNSTLEFAGGSGSIGSLGVGSGTVAENGPSWNFVDFGSLSFDAGGKWALNGPADFTNNGTVEIGGSLDISAPVDPSSSGLFLIDSNATLEVASVLGTTAKMQFLPSSNLVIDNAASFGTGVLLEGFAHGDTIDIKNFGLAGADLDFDRFTGLLQLSNSAGQVASLQFQNSSLLPGIFKVAGDGAGGIAITHTGPGLGNPASFTNS